MNRLFSILLLGLLWSVPGYAVPAVVDTCSAQGTGATQTISCTVTAGSTILVVACELYNEAVNTIDSGVWNTSETLTSSGTPYRYNGSKYLSMWHLGSPGTGAHNIVMTASASSTWQCMAYTLSGTVTTAPTGYVNSGSTGFFADVQVVVTCPSTAIAVDFVYYGSGANPAVQGTGHTAILQPSPNNNGWGTGYTLSSTNPTLSWATAAGDAASIGMCIAAAGGGGSTPRTLMLLGVGD